MNTKILVLCTGNSCRSQMAEGYLRHFAPSDVSIYSAGLFPHGVNPVAMEVMKEDGIDISTHTSNHLDEYAHIHFQYVITVCDHAAEQCPVSPAEVKIIHHNFEDPAKTVAGEDAVKEKFREIRDQIKVFCRQFISSNLT